MEKPVAFAPEPMALPMEKPVAFAPVPKGTCYWPVISKDEDSEIVSYRFGQDESNVIQGRFTKREFYALRGNWEDGFRHHAAIDLYAKAGDLVISCENGTFLYKIENFVGNTSAIYVEHPHVIAVYGQIKHRSWEAYNINDGDSIKAGQVIGEVGINPEPNSQLHFETWEIGLKNIKFPLAGDFRLWKKDGKPPQFVLNPTKYLLYIKNYGVKLRPGDIHTPSNS
jgi:murein DD-endopeptidase MepM/ murein hydrolase activator NlpD